MKTIKIALGDVVLGVEKKSENCFEMTAIDCDGDLFVTENFETLSEAVAAVATFSANEYRDGSGDIAITVLD